MSVCNFIKVIDGTECIGDSRGTINQNFINLDNMVCALSTDTFIRNAVGGTELNYKQEVTLVPGLLVSYNFLPAAFNSTANPYDSRTVVTYIGSNSTAATFTSPTQQAGLIPNTVSYINGVAISQIDALLVKIKVNGILQRNSSIQLYTRRSSAESWYKILDVMPSGSANGWSVDESTTEIIYFNKATNKFDWYMFDPSTDALAATPATYNITIELLGYYFQVGL